MSFYLGTEPVPQAILRKESTTLTAGQTVISTGGYSNGDLIQVSLNGVIIEGSGVDYTASNGSDITLTVAGSAGDVLQFQTFDAFELVGSKFAAPTITNDVTLKNNTEEDTDGGRSSKLVYKGEQSGGQESTLAEIQASHDGSSNDEKGSLSFKTNDGNDGSAPTERLKIDSAGLIGINVTNPDNYYADSLVVGAGSEGGITIAADANTHNNYLMFADGTSGSEAYRGYILYEHGASPEGMGLISYGRMRFYTSANGTTATERWRIEENGNLKAVQNGNGIDFSASEGSGATSSVLSDYEEGTYNATFTTQYGSIALNGSANKLKYTKIGRQVSITGRVILSTCSGQSGWVKFSLPFTNANETEDESHTLLQVATYNVSGIGTGQLFAEAGPNVDTAILLKTVDNTGWDYLNASDMSAGDIIYMNGTYFIS